jgi:hypothetical protein
MEKKNRSINIYCKTGEWGPANTEVSEAVETYGSAIFVKTFFTQLFWQSIINQI